MEGLKKMNNGLLAYRVPKEKNAPSTLLYLFEMELLAQIIPFSYVKSVDLIDAYSTLRKKYGFSDNKNAVHQKLYRLKERGILAHYIDRGKMGYQLISECYYYGLTGKGYRLLANAGVITEEEAAELILSRKPFKRNSLHTNACIKLTLTLYADLEKNSGIPNYELTRGTRHEWFKEKGVNANGQLVTIHPDVLLEIGNNIIAFEMDGGKQREDVIASKGYRYNKVVQKHSDESKRLFVVFVPIDSDISLEYSTLRTRRIVLLKSVLADLEDKPMNVEYYAFSLRELLPFVHRIADGTELRTSAAKKEFLSNWRTELEMNMNSLNYVITPINEGDFAINPQRMRKQISQEFLPDLALQFKLGNKKAKHYFICAHRPGSVTDYRKYLNMLRRIEAINSHEAIPFDVRFIALHETENEMRHDVLDYPAGFTEVEVFGTNYEEWERHSINVTDFTKVPLPFYELHAREHGFKNYKEGYRF